MKLQALRVDYKDGETLIRVQYQAAEDSPNPGTKARKRQVSELVEAGLERALASLREDECTTVGESGFLSRLDTLCMARKGG